MRRQRIKQKTYKKQVEENKKYSRKDGEKMEQTKKERIWRKKVMEIKEQQQKDEEKERVVES